MAEGKTNMFGKTYNTIGSTDSNFIIKTKGDLKVQWGNKYIDIIKNGKIASKDSNLLKQVASKDDIKSDGIYIVGDSAVYVSIGDTIIDLLGETGTTYVSFLEEQETTPEQKYQALQNIGFIYNTLKEVEEASLQSGIVYVSEKNKLYIIVNGKIQEYLISFEPEEQEKEEVEEKPLTELIIGDLRIYNDMGYSKFNSSTRIQLLINGNPYISLEQDLVRVHKSLVIDDDFYIQSIDASEEKGFRLYQNDGKSTIEVDNIIWRNLDKQLPVNRLTEGIIYSKYDNVITNIISESDLTSVSPVGDVESLYVYLKYKNIYQTGQFVYFYPKTQLIVGISQIQDKITVFLENSRICEKDITVQINYDDTKNTTATIPAGKNSIEFSLAIKIINNISIITAPEDVITQYDLNSKNTKYEFEIKDSQEDYIIIQTPIELVDTVIANSFDSLIHLSRDPYIEVIDNNMLLLDRSKKVIVEGEETPDETIHTQIGIIKESEIESLTKCPSKEEDIEALKEYESSIQVGIYSDNFIGLNSKLYNPVFKKRCDNQYPIYDELLTTPEERLVCDKKFNPVVPNLLWIKQMMDYFIPIGTIIMFNSNTDIPPGWAICDGSNGTPDLRNRFIKGTDGAIGVSDPEGVEWDSNNINKFKIEEKHLPKHTHEANAHTHNISEISGTIQESGDLTVTLEYSDYNWDVSESMSTVISSVSGEGITTGTTSVGSGVSAKTQGGQAVGGNHSHNITISGGVISEAISTEKEKEWVNDKITIEPKAFSLIFIMKIKDFVDYTEEV